MPLHWRATALLFVAACAHELPPEPVTGLLDSFGDPGPPARLTFNAGRDAAAAFTPDGRGIWYSWEKIDRSDRDLCLGFLAPDGGTRTREYCHTRASANPDSANWYIWAAPHPDGRRVAWFRMSAIHAPIPSFAPSGEVVMAALGAGRTEPAIDSLQGFPTAAPSGKFYNLPERLQWEDDSTLVFLAIQLAVEFHLGLPQDTIFSGLEVGTITLGPTGAHLGYVPGTTGATGVSAGPGRTVYFTLIGDNRIFRTGVAGGAIDTLFDFGPGTVIARDPAVHDTIAYGIVDGDVEDRFFTDLGTLQSDGGGALWRVTPGTRTMIDSSRRWRRPVFSPDGSLIVVEGRDTITGVTDLYRLRTTP